MALKTSNIGAEDPTNSPLDSPRYRDVVVERVVVVYELTNICPACVHRSDLGRIFSRSDDPSADTILQLSNRILG
jgi:hypothetical protein